MYSLTRGSGACSPKKIFEKGSDILAFLDYPEAFGTASAIIYNNERAE
jgi:hypothetical protein